MVRENFGLHKWSCLGGGDVVMMTSASQNWSGVSPIHFQTLTLISIVTVCKSEEAWRSLPWPAELRAFIGETLRHPFIDLGWLGHGLDRALKPLFALDDFGQCVQKSFIDLGQRCA